MTLDSAIPEHLRCTRRCPVNTPANFQPPYPCYTARFPENVSNLVMAIIGAQHRTAAELDATAQSTLTTFLTASGSGTAPSFFEWASVTDNKGFYNVTALAYWPSKASYESWADESGFRKWWQALEPQAGQPGWFLEVFFPTLERFETLFNTHGRHEGSAHMTADMSGEIVEHGYWGSMRDRIPLAQTDGLVGEKAERPVRDTSVEQQQQEQVIDTSSARIRIAGRTNLAIIRSGQDWHETSPEERALYIETMHPVLVKGMDFLRDHGDEVGCYSCRLMEIIEPVSGGGKSGAAAGDDHADSIDRTFGLAYFDDLASLERWCREHPTHLAIFGGFMRYAQKLGNNVTLRVFHEVMVLEPEQQLFEYIGCHAGTGMLATYRGM